MILVAVQKRKYFVIDCFLDSFLFFRRVVIDPVCTTALLWSWASAAVALRHPAVRVPHIHAPPPLSPKKASEAQPQRCVCRAVCRAFVFGLEPRS